MSLAIRGIGTTLDRLDGPAKVAGTARYAYEHAVQDPAYAFPIQSTIAKGRIVAIDANAARSVPGVIAVLSHENALRLAPTDNAELAVLQSDAVAYYGQLDAAVVAESLETARDAASLVEIRYASNRLTSFFMRTAGIFTSRVSSMPATKPTP
jgi:xanthine dehydrogenase YagR molybdenum-binding subunit